MPSTFCSTAAGMEKSMATSMPRKFSGGDALEVGVVELVELERDGEAVLGRELLDQPAHLAVADNGEAAVSGMDGLAALEDRGIELGEELVVQRLDGCAAGRLRPRRS